METIKSITEDIRNDADRDCVYNHEDLRRLADRLDASAHVSERHRLGDVVCICLDPNWRGVITEVSEHIGGVVNFKVEWRDGRDFQSRWFAADEVLAFQKLEEK